MSFRVQQNLSPTRGTRFSAEGAMGVPHRGDSGMTPRLPRSWPAVAAGARAVSGLSLFFFFYLIFKGKH